MKIISFPSSTETRTQAVSDLAAWRAGQVENERAQYAAMRQFLDEIKMHDVLVCECNDADFEEGVL